MVIYERGEPDLAVDLLRFAPGALVIDVSMDPGPTFTYHREEIPARKEGLLRAIRGIRQLQGKVVAGTVAGMAAIVATGVIGGS